VVVLYALLCATIPAAAAPAAHALGWPDRPLRLPVPFGAGISTDPVAPILAESFEPSGAPFAAFLAGGIERYRRIDRVAQIAPQ
jgi:hypothetical protein